MSYLKSALKLAEMGYHVFPLKENTKNQPLIKDYEHNATTDPEQIKRWWTDPVLDVEKPHNIGISTSTFNGGASSLVVVDVDFKGGKNGYETLKELKQTGHELPKSVTQTTPTGGKHIIYLNPNPVSQGVNKLGLGLDIRSKGGYIVGAGSTIDLAAYSMDGVPQLSQCPSWIIEKCGKAVEKVKTEVNYDIPQAGAQDRCIQYLKDVAPLALEGDGGDHTTFVVAARLKDMGAEMLIAQELMLEHWNDRCEPPWSPEELETKVKNAYGYGKNIPGVDAPQAQFDEVEVDPEHKSYLEKINDEFALVFQQGAHTVLHEHKDFKGRPTVSYITEVSFKRKLSPQTVMIADKVKKQADMWLNWVGRRDYEGICFIPEMPTPNGYFNTWRGFAYKQTPYEKASTNAKAGFDSFMSHAKKNVCDNDEELFTWLMGYFAHMIQKPYERPLTTLVFRGSKGVGKNALVDRIGKLLGSNHYIVAHDSRYLTSNFNSYMDSCLCLVLDEAFWSGDKGAEGKLKGLTTAPEIMIEKKGKEPYMIDNLLRLVIIGNEDWLVPASSDERRYAVFQVGEGNKQQGKFFQDMRENLDDKGGAEVLMDYFKNFDLSKADVNTAPLTDALLDQKESSASPFEQFWHDCLTEGGILYSEFEDTWPEKIVKGRLLEAFKRYCESRNIRTRIPDRQAFGKKIFSMCGGIKNGRAGSERQCCYIIPSLAECRQAYEDRAGQKVKWPQFTDE